MECAQAGIEPSRGLSGEDGGMGLDEVKHHKGIPPGDELLDRVGPLELAAHDFRITLTEDCLNRDSVKSEKHAIQTHRKVGEEVRDVIKRDNGASPENLPVAPSIKRLVNRERKQLRGSKKGR
jgi:hypothetical protein